MRQWIDSHYDDVTFKYRNQLLIHFLVMLSYVFHCKFFQQIFVRLAQLYEDNHYMMIHLVFYYCMNWIKNFMFFEPFNYFCCTNFLHEIDGSVKMLINSIATILCQCTKLDNLVRFLVYCSYSSMHSSFRRSPSTIYAYILCEMFMRILGHFISFPCKSLLWIGFTCPVKYNIFLTSAKPLPP